MLSECLEQLYEHSICTYAPLSFPKDDASLPASPGRLLTIHRTRTFSLFTTLPMSHTSVSLEEGVWKAGSLSSILSNLHALGSCIRAVKLTLLNPFLSPLLPLTLLFAPQNVHVNFSPLLLLRNAQLTIVEFILPQTDVDFAIPESLHLFEVLHILVQRELQRVGR
ncbi:hypothetical protein CC78DRAFT_532572 [Lojkania enalia]|uniref:Uncharacterized protein n=1 Tax=Lojkania enalia TaxID=147567 RepID=A0A9P4N8K5_9PLEO|nr:hypothetical protein CC78DRAFT_532572 [Didymosphaeria enalia]